MPYDPVLVQPMRDELTRMGVRELRTSVEVENWMSERSGTSLLIVNSVCGCAAGSARPGLALALASTPRPDRVATVFAGQDLEATACARAHFADFPPSSPSFALFRDGRCVHFVPRHQVEGRDAGQVGAALAEAFAKFCGDAREG